MASTTGISSTGWLVIPSLRVPRGRSSFTSDNPMLPFLPVLGVVSKASRDHSVEMPIHVVTRVMPNLDPSTISCALAELERQGLITAIRDPHGHVDRVILTEGGRHVAELNANAEPPWEE